MILQALYAYYHNLRSFHQTVDSDDGGRTIPPPGMEWKTIPFLIIIKRDGRFVRIELSDDREFLVPKDNARTSKIEAQLLWDHCGYVLGVPKTESPQDVKNCEEQFRSFQEKVKSLPDTEEINAVKNFYEKGEFLKVQDHEHFKDIQKSKGGRITFIIEDDFLEVASLPVIVNLVDPKNNHTSSIEMRCLVTGKKSNSITLTHEKIALGKDNAPFIGIQKGCGFDSYGKQQGLNAPISIEASDAIGSALKELLKKGRDTNIRIGNTVYIFWSSLQNPDFIKNYKKLAFYVEDSTEEAREEDKSKNPELEAKELFNAMQLYTGHKGSYSTENNERFFMLGLMPNSGRIAVKFWAEGSVSEMIENAITHLEDLNIISKEGRENNPPNLRSLFSILYALKPEGKRLDKMSTNLLESIVDSIVKNRPYPTLIQQLCLDRNRKKRKVTELRAAILKAFINRKNRYLNKHTIMTTGLDKNQTDLGYLTGRLFAIYEYTQRKALGELNATIADKYFSKASLIPKAILPKLRRLNMKHLHRLRMKNPGLATIISQEINQIEVLFPSSPEVFPQRFSLDQQTTFGGGYYHQRVELWKPVPKEEKEE